MLKTKRAAVIVLCMSLLLCMCVSVDAERAPLTVYVLDVGQGDAVLMRTEQGDILIDAGTEASETYLCLRLEQLGVRRLKLAIFTHFDEDHIGGADGVLRHFPTECVWVGGGADTSEASGRLIRAIDETHTEMISASVGTRLSLGTLTLTVLFPFIPTIQEGNAAGLVVMARFGRIQMLFMGDAEAEQESAIMERYSKPSLNADLYKVGHHGSQGASSEMFLQYVSPEYAVISCGASNHYGHPAGMVLERLEVSGATVLRTDLLGELVFECDGEHLICRSCSE